MSKGILGASSLVLQTVMVIVLQVASVVVLWSLNPLDMASTDTFALYLSVDLVAFAVLSYQYRSRKWEGTPDPSWVALGYFVMVVLLAANLLLL